MGYDLHITRAGFWPESTYYPILERELADLIEREPDLWFEPDRKGQVPAHIRTSRADRIAGLPTGTSLRTFGWDDGLGVAERGLAEPNGAEWLQVSRGQIQRKWPSDALTRRMAGIARSLDAWLEGDDGELYVVDADGQIISRERTAAERHPGWGTYGHRFLARDREHAWRTKNPIQVDEWLHVVAERADFRIGAHVAAPLPSGRKRISCPPVAHWIGHPSSEPVPFFHDDDGYVVVHHADPATIGCLTDLAPLLNAAVLED